MASLVTQRFAEESNCFYSNLIFPPSHTDPSHLCSHLSALSLLEIPLFPYQESTLRKSSPIVLSLPLQSSLTFNTHTHSVPSCHGRTGPKRYQTASSSLNAKHLKLGTTNCCLHQAEGSWDPFLISREAEDVPVRRPAQTVWSRRWGAAR